MPSTEHFGWPYPELSDEADVPADMQAALDAIEGDLHGLDVTELGDAGETERDPGDLLIVGAGGINAWLAMQGDATMSSAGFLTVANDAITTAKIKDKQVSTDKLIDLSVTEAKLAEAAVTSRKTKITRGALIQSAELLIKESNQNQWLELTGMNVTLNYPYKASAIIRGYFDTEIFMSELRKNLTYLSISVNGEVQSATMIGASQQVGAWSAGVFGLRQSSAYEWIVNIPANTNTTIAAMAYCTNAGNGAGTKFLSPTIMRYEVYAQ